MGAAVSFIIPAYRSGSTIGRTLASLAAQSVPDWEAIVVNDGADDDGPELAAGWAARDPRIRSFDQPHGGASRARNTGITRSSGEWLVFLDADDTISPNYLEAMLRKARLEERARRRVDVIACGFCRVDEHGKISGRFPPLPLADDPLAVCVAGPPGAIHSFMVRRSRVVEAGGFDEALVTNEDWDLWLRVARPGARFVVLERQLAFYWSTPGSLSRAGRQMIQDAAIVMERARLLGLKPRPGMEAFDRRHETTADLALRNAFWSAGVAIGHGQRTDDLIAHLPIGADARMQKTHLVDRLVDGLVVGAGIPYPHLAQTWGRFASGIDAFLAGVVRRCGNGDEGSFGLMELIQITVARYGRFGGEIELGPVVAVMIGVRIITRGYRPPPQADVVVLRLPWVRPATLFSFVVPALGRIGRRDIVRVILWEMRRRLSLRAGARPLLVEAAARLRRGKAIAGRVLPILRSGPRRPMPGVAREAVRELAGQTLACLAASGLPRRAEPLDAKPHPGAGSSAEAWERLFATEDPWNYGSAYEQQKYRRTLSLIPPSPGGDALEIACAEGRFTELLAPEVGTLTALDISTTAIARAERRTVRFGNVRFAQGDLFRDGLSGAYDLVTCSEMLYFAPSAAALARVASEIATVLRPGGHFVHAHAYAIVDSPGRTGFDWGNRFGAASIHEALAREPRLALVRTIETDLYRIDLFRRAESGSAPIVAAVEKMPIDTAIEPRVAADIVWEGAIRSRSNVAAQRTYRVPVLALSQISPHHLETHLRFLRRRGFRSVTPDELEKGKVRAGSLRGRPILLTADWSEQAAETVWPIVCRNGFLLHLFVATDTVRDWQHIIDLAATGVSFGSRLASGSPADELTSMALLEEGLRSRLMLEHVLRVPITTAAPAGLSDTRIEHVLGVAGYTRLFGRGGGMAMVAGGAMRTPRLRIAEDCTLEELAASVGDDIEPPDERDWE
jgi:SAM-dependent methyltransferase